MENFFTYGTLKRGHRLHHVLEKSNCKFISDGFTDRGDLVMRRTNPKPFGFPVLLPEAMGLPIYGEIWEIPERLIPELDYIESNKVMYQRELVQIRPSDGPTLSAWCYLGIPEYWGRLHRGPFPICDIKQQPLRHFVFNNA